MTPNPTTIRLRPLAAWTLLAMTAIAARAQFKEIKAAPFPPAVAHRRIAALLESVDASNRDQTIATISGWLDWYRDVLDEELIAHWESDARAPLPLVMAPLADARVASEVVDYSWRRQPEAAFTLAYAPMLGDLMARYPASGQTFLADLLAPTPPNLPLPVAQTACRILLDMPDIGAWRKSALQILPRYRAVVDPMLKQDANSPDQELMYRALRWRVDLKLDPPAVTSQKQTPKRSLTSRLSLPKPAAADPAAPQRPHIVDQAPPDAAAAPSASGFQHVIMPAPYIGPTSGVFESTGGPIPPNGEYVFENIPPAHLLLDFDTKHWEAHLDQRDGAQVLIVRNISKGNQKRCVIKWSVMQ